jgi:glutamate formiminotransferase
MRLLSVPQWSFGRDRALLREFSEILDLFRLTTHYLVSDSDHNRTVSAFSGDPVAVFEALERLCVAALPRIDLQRHSGTFPRIGALDVCPLIPLTDVPVVVLNRYIDQLAWTLADFYKLPVFLYEKSERNRPESELAQMRKGGFGALLERELHPDYGPNRAHPNLGILILGQRDFLLSFNINLKTEDLSVAQALSSHMRDLRTEGDERFLGARVLPLRVPSKEQTQLHVCLALPDLTPVDPIVEWVRIEASRHGTVIVSTHLVGAIRKSDLAGATRVPFRAEQVIELS